jgi:hypothetical protein
MTGFAKRGAAYCDKELLASLRCDCGYQEGSQMARKTAARKTAYRRE